MRQGPGMKLRFSGITIGFTLAGLGIGLMVDWIFFLSAQAPALSDFISDHIHAVLLLCPSSFAFSTLGFRDQHDLYEIFTVYVTVPMLNTVLYGLAGLALSWIYHLSKKLTKPKAA